MTQSITQTLSRLFLLGVLLSFALGLNYLNAWTAPTLAPTGGNVAAPLNTGGTLQGKSGGLQMSSLDINGTNGVSLVGGQLSFWNNSTIVNPSYTIDMGDLDPGANNGIRFPDDTVQTTAGGGSATSSSIANAIGGGGLVQMGVESNLGSDWSAIIIGGQFNVTGGDGKGATSFVYRESGVVKAVLAAGQGAAITVNPVTTTKACANGGASPAAVDVCVRLSGTNILVHAGNDTRLTYLIVK